MADIKDNPVNIYLFCGEDSFSAFEKAMLWKAKFIEKFGDLNLLSYKGEELTASEFQTALESYPFLSDKKLVFISDFLAEGKSEAQKAVADLLDQVPDYAVVLFFEHQKPDARTGLYKKLVKLGKLENYTFKTGPELYAWITDRFAKRGGRVAPDVVRKMADLVGGNLWNLANEVEKVLVYANGGQITTAMVEEVVCPNPVSSVFKLTDYLSYKNAPEALKVLEILVESGEDAMQILFMLVRQFRILAQVMDLQKKGMPAGAIAKAVRLSPFVVNKAYAQCKNFSFENLIKFYQGLLNIDTGVKTGRIRMLGHDQSELIREIEVLIAEGCRV